MDTEGMFLTAVIEGSKASFLLRLVSFCCSGSPPQKAPRDSSPSSGEQRTAVRREEQPWKELGPGRRLCQEWERVLLPAPLAPGIGDALASDVP